jgi:hypothetical protein
MINYIKDAVTAVSGIKTFLFNTDYRNNFDLQNVEFPCCVLTPIMRTNYDLNNIIRESAELQLSVVDLAPYEYTGDDLYAINKRCSDLALQVISNLQVKSKLDKELTFEFILPSGDELISGVMCNLTATMKQGYCIGAPSYVEVIVQPIKRESITSNGKHVISPSSGFNAMREVEVDVNVDLKGSLQDKQVTITENGTQTITADEGYEGLNSVEVNSEVYEGFDFGEFSNEINQNIKKNIDLTKEINSADTIQGGYSKYAYSQIYYLKKPIKGTDGRSTFTFSALQYVDVPYIEATYANSFFGQCGSLVSIKADTTSATTFQSFAIDCHNLVRVEIKATNATIFNAVVKNAYKLEFFSCGSIKKITSTIDSFSGCYKLTSLYFEEWTKTNISVANSSLLSPESIHHNIQNAVSLADGATARTLTLHATAKTNWQNSEYYEQDLAVLTDKGITIA